MSDDIARILIPEGRLEEVVRAKVIEVVVPCASPQWRVLGTEFLVH